MWKIVVSSKTRKLERERQGRLLAVVLITSNHFPPRGSSNLKHHYTDEPRRTYHMHGGRVETAATADMKRKMRFTRASSSDGSSPARGGRIASAASYPDMSSIHFTCQMYAATKRFA